MLTTLPIDTRVLLIGEAGTDLLLGSLPSAAVVVHPHSVADLRHILSSEEWDLLVVLYDREDPRCTEAVSLARQVCPQIPVVVLVRGGDMTVIRDGQVLPDAVATPVGLERLLALTLECAGRETGRPYVSEILESISDAFFSLDNDWRFTYLNSRAETVLGRSKEELLGREIWQAFPESVGFSFEQQYREAKAETRAVEFEEYYVPLGIWLGVKAFPHASGLSVYFRDISQRKNTEAALQESEGMFRATFELAAVGIALTGVDGTLQKVNHRFAEIVGYSEDELAGRSFRDITHPDDLNEDEELIARLLSGQVGIYLRKKRYVRKDGRVVWVSLSSSLRRNPDGSPRHFIAVIQDITDQKQMETALRMSEERFSTTFRLAGVAIAHMGLDGRWLVLNDKLCEFLGYKREELLARTFQDITHPDDLEADLQFYSRLKAGEIPHYRMEKRYLHKQGRVVWASLNVSLVRDESNRPLYSISVIEDITARKTAEARLQDREMQFRLAMQVARVGAWSLDFASGEVEWSRELSAIFGWPGSQRFEWERFYDAIVPEDRDRVRVLQERLAREGGPDEEYVDYRILRTDGQLRWLRSGRRVTRNERRNAVRLVGFIQDITEQKQAEEALKEERERLHLAVDTAQLGFWEWNMESDTVYLSPMWKQQLGYGPDQLPAEEQPWFQLAHPEERERTRNLMKRFINSSAPELELEFRLRHKNGEYRWMLAHAIAIRNAEGRAVRLIGTQYDITERKMAETQIREAALHDPLTGLPTRTLIFEYASHMLAIARRTRGRVALMFLDLDRFKPINDIYGHEIGDRLLQEVAKRLRNCCREEDVVGRLGGDEFVIALPHLSDATAAARAAAHIVEAIGKPYNVDTLELSVSPSIGISLFPDDGSNISSLLRAADLAMYQAKQAGRNTFHFYSPDLEVRAAESLSIETQLKRALARNALIVHYQPVLDLSNGEVVGAEALVRMRDETTGSLLMPSRFISIAESSGLISLLGDWVVAEACRQHQEWLQEGLPPVTVSINVSPLQLRQKNFADGLQRIIERSGIEARYLQIEVTESAVMHNVEEAIAILKSIKALGVKIALDDFGTGYSSLSHLSSLPLDKLKVDQSFVMRISEDKSSRAITEAIIALGRTLELEVVGEGIDSEQALAYLRAYGCDQMQGFYLCRPMPGDEFARWRRERQAPIV